MRILGLIPARGGSKGIPRKNLALLRGRPLLAWTCEAALAAQELAAVVLSTDDDEIAGCGRRCGVRVPFLRPADLALDTTPSLPVVQHALKAMEALDGRYDAVCLLQPTNPLRAANDIDAACTLFRAGGADSVVAVRPVPAHFHPFWTYLEDAEGCLVQAAGRGVVARRQDLPPAFWREGSVYVTARDTLLEHASLYGARMQPYLVPEERCGNIDTLRDLQEMERRMGAA